MAAIAHSVFRVALLLAVAITPASADVEDEIRTLVADAAAALSEANQPAFLKCFELNDAARDAWRMRIDALLAKAEVSSSISILRVTGDTAEVDWFLAIQRRDSTAPVERRREVLSLQLVKRGKKWRIANLTPAEFFRPPSDINSDQR
jgi:hypothetical protein